MFINAQDRGGGSLLQQQYQLEMNNDKSKNKQTILQDLNIQMWKYTKAIKKLDVQNSKYPSARCVSVCELKSMIIVDKKDLLCRGRRSLNMLLCLASVS